MPKIIIQTEKDVRKIQGKFVVQLDNHSPDKEIMEMNWGFVKEKRLYIVAGYGFVNLFGDVKNYENFEKFKNIFNNYLFPSMIEKGDTDGNRFHRLLNKSELDYLITKIKEENNV